MLRIKRRLAHAVEPALDAGLRRPEYLTVVDVGVRVARRCEDEPIDCQSGPEVEK